MDFQASEGFYALTPYYLRELLGGSVVYIDVDVAGQFMSISANQLEFILDDEKKREESSYFKLYPLFEKFTLKQEDRDLNRKYWKLLKESFDRGYPVLPTDFSKATKEDLIYWFGPLARGKKGTMDNYTVEELRSALSSQNQKANEAI